MARRTIVAGVFVASLLAQALALPAQGPLRVRIRSSDDDLDLSNDIPQFERGDSHETELKISEPVNPAATLPPTPPPFDDDDEDFSFDPPTAPSGGGSNIFSLLNLASALFPGSSGPNVKIRKMINDLILKHLSKQALKGLKIPHHNISVIKKRSTDLQVASTKEIPKDIKEKEAKKNLNKKVITNDTHKKTKQVKINEITIATELKPPPLQRQEIDESESEDDDTKSEDDTESDNDTQSETDEEDSKETAESREKPNKANGNDKSETEDDNNAAEQSVENGSQEEKPANGNGNDIAEDSEVSDEFDSSEPPEGDGQGGGILGLLAGLSGGEDGQSDLGSLLAAVSGIVVNLSGDGVDVNALIASGLGLFVGLLSEGNENPGSILASYLLTSLETLTGGGAKNNGVFFGTFLSKLISGTSAVTPNTSSSGSAFSPIWDFKLDVFRAFLKLSTTLIGKLLSSSVNLNSNG